MMVPAALLLLGALTAVVAPRLLARADWPDREPVVALWVWQCVVAAVLVCCVLSMTLSAAGAWEAVRGHVFAPAPHSVVNAYALGPGGGGRRDGGDAGLRRAVERGHAGAGDPPGPRPPPAQPEGTPRPRAAAARRGAGFGPSGDHRGRAPRRLVAAGAAPQLALTTAALRRLRGKQLDAVLAHEQGHAQARHDWLLHCSDALANGFPQVPVFAAFRDEMHRLVELAADDMASRRFGRLTTALALVGLNEDRGLFGPCPTPQAHVPQRVNRLLTPPTGSGRSTGCA